jgi:lysylphosphatidylglycerol synthetase-like protein (DUF2156 family)
MGGKAYRATFVTRRTTSRSSSWEGVGVLIVVVVIVVVVVAIFYDHRKWNMQTYCTGCYTWKAYATRNTHVLLNLFSGLGIHLSRMFRFIEGLRIIHYQVCTGEKGGTCHDMMVKVRD